MKKVFVMFIYNTNLAFFSIPSSFQFDPLKFLYTLFIFEKWMDPTVQEGDNLKAFKVTLKSLIPVSQLSR